MMHRGLEIIVSCDSPNSWTAGFPKNPGLVHADNEQEAVQQMKKLIDGFPAVVLHTYEAHGKQMRELED